MNTALGYRWADMPRLIATAVLYALLAKLVLTFYSANGLVTVFWPGAGLSLAIVLLAGKRFLPSIYIGALLGAVASGQSLGQAALVSIGSTLEPLLGAWLLTRRDAFDVSLRSVRDYFRLCLLAGAISPCVCTAIGVSTLLYAGHIGVGEVFSESLHWWAGDTLGIVLIAPLFMVWRHPPAKDHRKLFEAIALLVISFLFGQVVFLGWFDNIFGLISRNYWMYAIASCAAIRLGVHGVLIILLQMTLQALVGAALGLGTFSNDLETESIANLWAFTTILTIVNVSLAIVFSERQRVLLDLGASNARYRSLFDNMLDGFAHCRMIFKDNVPIDYEFIAVNPAFEQVSGLHDVVGRKISEIVPGYALENAISLRNFGRVTETGEAARWEHYFRALDRWYSFASYRPAAGEFVAIIDNITARKRVEGELNKLSLAVEQSPISIIITDLEGRIEYVNPAFSVASGYISAEVVGKNPRLLQSGTTPKGTYRELWAALLAGKMWQGELFNRRKDGTEYVDDASISPLRQSDGSVTHYVAVQADVTKLKRTIAELRSSEERLRLAKTAARLGTYDYDIDRNTLECDELVREFWGIENDAPVSCAVFMGRVHVEDRALLKTTIDRAINSHASGECRAEFRVLRREDGTSRDVEANGLLCFEDGHPVRAVGTIKDISSQKQLENEARNQRKEMEGLINQQVAAQTATAIAHELNQPLVAISAYSEAALRMLRDGIKSPGKMVQALEGAVKQAQRGGRTLHELLEFLHKGEVVFEPVNLNEVVTEAIAIAERSGYGGFRQVVELESGLRPVLANRLQIQKVLVNLLHNAVEAMRSADVPTAAIVIRVQTATERNFAEVTVQDNGPGLSPEFAERIFAPFFTTKDGGIGLGLAISRAIVEAHNGQLWVDLHAAPGATFHFILPFAK